MLTSNYSFTWVASIGNPYLGDFRERGTFLQLRVLFSSIYNWDQLLWQVRLNDPVGGYHLCHKTFAPSILVSLIVWYNDLKWFMVIYFGMVNPLHKCDYLLVILLLPKKLIFCECM